MATKTVLTIEKKIAILDRLKTESATQLAREYNLGNSTLTDMKNKEDKLREFAATLESQSYVGKRKVMRLAKDQELDEALYMWFVQKRAEGMPISGPMLCEKASYYHERLHNDSADQGEGTNLTFKASSGWLWRFCDCHGIRQLPLQGEKLSADVCAPEPFKKTLSDLMTKENLSIEQIYNCDETGLYFRLLPQRTLAANHEKQAPGRKKSKERVTLMACANVSGSHKFPLVFIAKAKRPRCFKGIDMLTLPVKHKEMHGWMHAEIFVKWFNMQFVP